MLTYLDWLKPRGQEKRRFTAELQNNMNMKEKIDADESRVLKDYWIINNTFITVFFTAQKTAQWISLWGCQVCRTLWTDNAGSCISSASILQYKASNRLSWWQNQLPLLFTNYISQQSHRQEGKVMIITDL